ncbi:hypothetical protein SAG0066_00715 [Streptococcus agalactiae CCUG 38383]|nr:hypothetical protein SAG0066_00715 [Streptococcus agalactiae CCUG 38383]
MVRKSIMQLFVLDQGYDLLISPNGSLIFEKQKRKILEDSFLIFSQPLDKNPIKCFYQGALIEKIMTFTSDEEITCVYKCNQKAKEMFPKLLKQTFKLHCQEQLIRDSEGYLVNVPGSYPIEHDDFLRADKFEDRQFHYYLPNEDKMISYSPPGKASNQMQFRPLCLIDTDSLSFPLTYHFRISQASSEEALINLKKQPIWDSNYQASDNPTKSVVLPKNEIPRDRNYILFLLIIELESLSNLK